MRTYRPKGNIQRKKSTTSPSKLRCGVRLMQEGYALRRAADLAGISRQSLSRIMKKIKESPDPTKVSFHLTHSSRNTFKAEEEKSIAEYCIQLSQMGYGLTVVAVRELAYEVAEKNGIKMPNSWEANRMAGIDWFQGFMKRHPEISIRTPEACSVARAMAFNKKNMDKFFDMVEEVMKRHPSFLNGSNVFNLDETRSSTVGNTPKIVSPKGQKQVHQIKGAERGTSVTTCMIIGAYGVVIPPVMIFPRKKYVPSLMVNAFPGSLGLANESGYMTKETFYLVMEHFIKFSNASLENPALLFLDNVLSHFSAATIDLAKSNGVVIVTFPPHTTHKVQPLDVGFFGPFKTKYDGCVNTFMMSNPGAVPTIYHVAGFVRDSLAAVARPEVIINSFKKTGIYPFDRTVFTETDFAMSKVTEKPDNSSSVETNLNVTPNEDMNQEESQDDVLELSFAEPLYEQFPNPDSPEPVPADTVTDPSTPQMPNQSKRFVPPAEIKGFPKAKDKEGKRKPRSKGRCFIPTDTPEKQAIEKQEREKEEKKKKSEERKIRAAEKKKERETVAQEKKLAKSVAKVKGKRKSAEKNPDEMVSSRPQLEPDSQEMVAVKEKACKKLEFQSSSKRGGKGKRVLRKK